MKTPIKGSHILRVIGGLLLQGFNQGRIDPDIEPIHASVRQGWNDIFLNIILLAKCRRLRYLLNEVDLQLC